MKLLAELAPAAAADRAHSYDFCSLVHAQEGGPA